MLESFGISNKEAKILYACMQVEGVGASEISKKTGIERTNVYKILERLVARGFVTTYKFENVTRYRSLEPKGLLGLLRDSFENFKKSLGVFEEVYSSGVDSSKVELFSGRMAVKKVIVSIAGMGLIYSAFGGVEEAYRQNYFENIPAGLLAQEQGILGRVLLSPGERTVIVSNEVYRIAGAPLPKGVCTIVNEEMVAIFNWGDYCNAVVITNRKIAEDYLVLFEGLWSGGRKVLKRELLGLELKGLDLGLGE